MENYQELNIDQEFWSDFTVEAFEHINDIESNVLTLEQNPEDMEIIHTMFRAFHTIKGLSGFVEHTTIQEIAHKTETLMDFCRKGELSVNTKIVDAILKSSDYIKRLCEELESYKDENFLCQIKSLLEVLEQLAVPPEDSSCEPAKTEQAQEEQNIEEQFFQTDQTEAKNTGSEIFQEQKNEEEPIKRDLEAFANEFFPLTEEKTEENEIEAQTALEPIKEEPKQTEKVKVETQKTEVQPVKKTFSSNEDYMKVSNGKIDQLVDLIGELIINQSLIEQYLTTTYPQDNKLTGNMSGFLRITRELQGLSMSLRMVSLKSTFQKITRIARDTIQELHKEVEFVTLGDSTEIDRVVTEKLLDPLVHLIKNAISHGVEDDPQERVQKGKNKKAKVELNAYNKRGKIFIEVKDDGCGINTDIVYKKALEKGLIDPNKNYSEEEIKEFILLPGFSTAKVVDNISGRGVGMDVVKTQILKLGGKIDIQSTLGNGSIFTLEVPVNHAIMNGTIIEMKNNCFIVPTMNVKEILQPKEEQWIFTQGKRTMLKVRENIVPIIPISVFFNGEKHEEEIPLVLLLEVDGHMKALPITNVLNRQEVVVKPVGDEFSNLKFISGMSILGTGKVSLILDIDYLFKKEGKL